MMAVDAALIQQCAAPTLKPAIVEKFIAAAGSEDPLAIDIRRGGSIVLKERPTTAEQAADLVRKNAGHAVIRVGLTHYPAGIGASDPSEISPDLFDPCMNLKMGTALFGKVYRVVLKWYGNPTDQSAMPYVLEDAVQAWKTGYFDGKPVFDEPDPEPTTAVADPKRQEANLPPIEKAEALAQPEPVAADDPAKAAIRVDLSKIGGREP